ncbi:Hypothetical predicted protein [Octopus vulgaris]|uniref:FLYWCH-type domain-containing protein n=1 Tax=Octopus vulgaris TaxID=6645 RepID=A0AA36F5Y6_OCTVU|nr:Hypothetical predicted protein [Octopus vulgaris]
MNYIYEVQKQNAKGSKTYWECEIKPCKAQVHTITHDEDYNRIKHIGEHHHSLCALKSKVRNLKVNLKAQATASQESSHSLIATACEKLDENEMAHMPSTVTSTSLTKQLHLHMHTVKTNSLEDEAEQPE